MQSFLFYGMDGLCCLFILLNMSKIKFKIFELISMFLLLLSIPFSFSSIVPEYLTSIIPNLSILTIISIFTLRNTKSFYYTILFVSSSMMLGLLANSISISITSVVFRMTISEMSTRSQIPLHQNPVYIVSSALFFTLSFYLTKLVRKLFISRLEAIPLNTKEKFSGYTLACMGLTIVIFYLNVFFLTNSDSHQLFVALNIILLLGQFLFFMLSSYTSVEARYNGIMAEHHKQTLENMKAYTEGIEKLTNEVRRFKHDQKNIMNIFHYYIETNDFPGLIKYYNEISSYTYLQIAMLRTEMAALSFVEMSSIKGLLAIKIATAQSENIDINLEVPETVKEFDVNVVDLCRIIGILIDNAVDECRKNENSYIRIALFNQTSGELEIVIRNSLHTKIENVAALSLQGYSTRGANRGFGLYNLQEIVARYSNLFLDTIITDSEFTQILTVTDRNDKEVDLYA